LNQKGAFHSYSLKTYIEVVSMSDLERAQDQV